MKKLFVALCALALSFVGTFGANQKSLNSNIRSNSSLSTLNAAQYAKDSDGQSSLSIDNKAAAVNNNTASYVTSAKAEAPKMIYAVQQNTTAANSTSADKQTAAVNANGTSNQAPQAVFTSTNCNTANKSVTNGQTTANSNIQNGQVIFKSVNSSNCQSVKDAVSQLQKNGYSNSNLSNIQNIQSLKDILANIQQKGNCSNGVNTSTVKPTPTAAPAPTKKPAAPTTAPKSSASTGSTNNSSSVSSYAAQVLQLVNQERAKAGLSAYTTNSTLTAAANVRAKEIAQSFSHTRPNGSSFSSVLKENGISYRTAGENIAYGQRTPQEVVTGWMNSPGHRANILNSNFNKIGIGVYQVNGVYYWSQEFTN